MPQKSMLAMSLKVFAWPTWLRHALATYWLYQPLATILRLGVDANGLRMVGRATASGDLPARSAPAKTVVSEAMSEVWYG